MVFIYIIMYASNWVHVYTKLKFWATENLIWNTKSPKPQAKKNIYAVPR